MKMQLVTNGLDHQDNGLEQEVLRITESLLGKSISVDEPFMQAGLDSMGATELQKTIERQFDIILTPTIAYDYPTVASLAKYIQTMVAAQTDDLIKLSEPLRQSPGQSMYIEKRSLATGFTSLACIYPHNIEFPAQAISQMLSGQDIQAVIPSSRWNVDSYYNPSGGERRMYVRFGGWISNLEAFDAAMFRLSPSEATGLDPQTRLLMEKALEVAALVPSSQADQSVPASSNAFSNTGVFIGCMYTEYLDGILSLAHLSDTAASSITGHGLSFMVGRLSFTFGWQGPCVSTDTACSSSLVALHLGQKGIRDLESDTSFVGGVNSMLVPQTTSRICMLQALSYVGRCKALDATADGYGRGEAVCVGMLAPLDYPNVDVLVVGSAVLQNGQSSGLTAPNGVAQATLIRQAMQLDSLHQSQVGMVSLHGTGTPLGDPIEVGALKSTRSQTSTQPFIFGASKTIFGHTEGTAGMTGVLLSMAYLKHNATGPVANNRILNPYVASSLEMMQNQGWALVPREYGPNAIPMMAGTSSFGMSGVNAHVILQNSNNIPTKTSSAGIPLRRKNCWPLPINHPLLLRAVDVHRLAYTPTAVSFGVMFQSPSLAIFKDHQVFGAPLLPAAVMFETLRAAMVSCMDDVQSKENVGLISIAINSAITLQPHAEVYHAKLMLKEGVLAIQNPRGVQHTQCETSVISTKAPTFKPHNDTPVNYSKSRSIGAVRKVEYSNFRAKIGRVAWGSAQYLQFLIDPACLDSCIHLAPIPLSGDVPVTRVPVSVQAFGKQLLNSGMVEGWASTNSPALGDGESDIEWIGGHTDSALACIYGLAARPMRANTIPGMNANLANHANHGDNQTAGTYFQEWQAHESSIPGGNNRLSVLLGPLRLSFKTGLYDEMPIHLLSIGKEHIATSSRLRIKLTTLREHGRILTAWAKVTALEMPHLVDFDDIWGAYNTGGADFQPVLQRMRAGERTQSNWTAGSITKPLGSYIISGGLGALGLLVGKSIAFSASSERVHLVLGARSANLLTEVPAYTSSLIMTTIVKADGAFKADMTELQAATKIMPIGSIHHAAGVLRDGPMAKQLLKNINDSNASKRIVGQALALLARTSPTAQQIFYGSIASSLGSGGQLPYAMANASLEELAYLESTRGQNSLIIAWGAWGGVGMAMGSKLLENRLHNLGVNLIRPEDGLAALYHLTRANLNCHNVIVANLDWHKLLRSSGHVKANFYSEISTLLIEDLPKYDRPTRPRTSLHETTRKRGNGYDISKAVSDVVSNLIGNPVDEKAPLLSLGLDSLAAGEVHAILERKFGVSLPSTLVFDHPNISSIVQLLASMMEREKEDSNVGPIVYQQAIRNTMTAPDSIVHIVAQRVDKVMGVLPSANVPLMEAGMDSLAAGQLQRELADAFSMEMPATIVFDYPTITSISSYIYENLGPMEDGTQSDLATSLQADTAHGILALNLPQHTANSNAPMLTKKGYFTVPSIKRLQRMSDSELQHIPRFVIGRQGFGEIAFLYPVDLLRANLDDIVHIDKGSIILYPGMKPQLGEGLNQPALLTFKKVFPRGKRTKGSLAAFKGLLLQASSRMGGTFVHWDPDEGVWIAKVDGFFF